MLVPFAFRSHFTTTSDRQRIKTTTHPSLFLERADNTRGPRWCAALYRRTNLLSVVPPSQHARRCTAVRRTRRTCQALYRRAEMPTVVPASRCASDQGARPIRPFTSGLRVCDHIFGAPLSCYCTKSSIPILTYVVPYCHEIGGDMYHKS